MAGFLESKKTILFQKPRDEKRSDAKSLNLYSHYFDGALCASNQHEDERNRLLQLWSICTKTEDKNIFIAS